ncbi:hypothetical protein BVC80_9043g30 [Macleaya cordata]|uniref:Type 2 DNA topoisomerase 6 subunit B-like n=1 Tax=Macleaya cordata TaxID=56857 RepID=A0A200R2N2_MACCD|nr:hypothetical protein BVC80_9043g30 [Macleaya cordata]
MESSSIQKLCENLICSAIQRCRISENLCRLSVLLKVSPDSDRPIVRIAISDTGVGSCLEEFQDLHYTGNNISVEKWGICDEEIYHYQLNLKENIDAKRLTRLPSTPKNGGKFSGTEVSLSTNESIENLVGGITCFLQKVWLVALCLCSIELVVERVNGPNSRCENIFLANGDILLSYPMSNIECLIAGFEDHVLKHGNNLDKECQSCFSNREYLKVGSGVACNRESLRSSGQVIEVVIIITELPEQSSPLCLRMCSTTTEVLYFQDFVPSSIPQSSLNVLTSIDWKSYGLSLRRNVLGENGKTVLEWENLPPFTHVDIAIHCYHKKYPLLRFPQQLPIHFDRNLVKKAVKLAMDDLKEKYTGILISAHALKIQSYAPDLARSIAGLILTSNDLEFQGECISLLGLQSQEFDEENVENHIKDKIIAVIEMNDRKPQKNRESAPFLFADVRIQEQEFQDEEDGGEEEFDILDL